jgi:BirA family biotin operon repressor/biotin-[acetyl-CoA-carboxylase] ligase
MPDPTETAALRDRAGFASIEVHPQLASTMERARELAADAAATLPALVMADRQTAGRGRQGAGWWQAEGSLAVSIVVDDQAVGVPVQPTWSLACGVALAEAIAALEPTVEPEVKWPNDLTVDHRKLAGILLETAPAGRTILGIGVNTSGSVADAPPPLRDRLTTLPDLTGRGLPRADLLVEFLPRFLALVREMHAAPEVLVNRYRGRCGLTGQTVTVYRGAEQIVGVCAGIAANGSLVVDTATGRQWLTSGSLTAPPTHTPPDRQSRAGAGGAENPRR